MQMTFDELQTEIDELTSQTVFWNHGKVLELLEQNTGIGKAVSLENDGQLAQTWGRLVEKLVHLAFPNVGLQAADRLYELQLEAQEASQKRLHKGVVLQVTGEIYLWLKRYALAKRYFQLALIEDTIEHKNKISPNFPAYKSLTRDLNVPSQDLDRLIKFTLDYIGETGEPRHPEKIYTDFLLSDERPKTRDVERAIVRINSIYAKSLLEQVNSPKTEKKEKGDPLEYLVAYLLSCVDGFEIVKKNQRTKDYEIDVLIRNTITSDPILAGFGPYIAIECKNWDEERVGSGEVNHFLAKIQFHDCHCGIMAAKSGITGRAKDPKEDKIDKQYAELTVLKAFHRNGIVMMVLDARDLEEIVEGKSNILSVLVSEYERIRFDKSSR